ncbi:uncharacterized protein LOC127858710 [Dreissena polymorpha]|uniref:ShKT domain-containing protein n=1 Tax=Dreissena polymorpha TaxID=45954 RepID=A0A9D3Z760_DREPO|nr:uncharacterized protein LOC127858710 [Dreissena polymorpha]KAH3711479.1 hypothetical protein DPMN_071148 [Dreissena polymorpha]
MKEVEKMSSLCVGVCAILTSTCLVLVVSYSDPCQDKVACNLYGSDICTAPAYAAWANANCPRFCGFCGVTTENHSGLGRFMDNGHSDCKDSLINCADYGTAICKDVKFYSWVNENCRRHCNRCGNDCRDVAPNCADFGSSVCTELSYYNWVEMNCRKFCARCTS